MRHQKFGRKLNMKDSHRDAMFRSMVTSLFKHRRIETTDARAKELRRIAERLITFAKRGDLHARRMVIRMISDRQVVHELFEEIGPHFAERNGGYTRIIKAGRRRGDNAPLSLIELVGMEPKIEELEEKVEKKRKKKDEKMKAAEQAAVEAKAQAGAEVEAKK